jgi:hypothetical protein
LHLHLQFLTIATHHLTLGLLGPLIGALEPRYVVQVRAVSDVAVADFGVDGGDAAVLAVDAVVLLAIAAVVVVVAHSVAAIVAVPDVIAADVGEDFVADVETLGAFVVGGVVVAACLITNSNLLPSLLAQAHVSKGGHISVALDHQTVGYVVGHTDVCSNSSLHANCCYYSLRSHLHCHWHSYSYSYSYFG